MRILIFYSDNSKACRQLEARLEFMFDQHEETNAYCEYVCAEDNPDDVEFYNVRITPALVLIDKAGAAVERMVGYDPALQYEQFILNSIRHKDDIDAHPQWESGNIDWQEDDE